MVINVRMLKSLCYDYTDNYNTEYTKEQTSCYDYLGMSLAMQNKPSNLIEQDTIITYKCFRSCIHFNVYT